MWGLAGAGRAGRAVGGKLELKWSQMSSGTYHMAEYCALYNKTQTREQVVHSVVHSGRTFGRNIRMQCKSGLLVKGQAILKSI